MAESDVLFFVQAPARNGLSQEELRNGGNSTGKLGLT